MNPSRDLPYFVHPLVLAATFVVSGCTSAYVSESHQSHAESLLAQQKSALTHGELSEFSFQVLRSLDLDEDWRSTPQSVPDRVIEIEGGKAKWVKEMARAEMLYLLAKRTSDTEKAQALYLEACIAAQGTLRSHVSLISAFDPRQRLLAETYNRALARFLVLRQQSHGHPSTWVTVPTRTADRPFELDDGEGTWAASDYDRLISAEERSYSGRLAAQNRYRHYGVGATMVGEAMLNEKNALKYHTPEIRVFPATAILDGLTSSSVRLQVLNPYATTTVSTSHGELPISADFTAPAAHLVAEIKPSIDESLGFFNPEKIEAKEGIYLAQPYDPNRIPLLCVHGLWSGPATWLELVNELWSIDEIRQRYQVWLYFYPTGRPIPLNAASLRQRLYEIREDLDPEGDDPAMRNMVVLAHSMGGILSKTLISRSTDELTEELLTKSIDDIECDDETRELLNSMLVFEPVPFVRRVLFLASPHRGSPTADNLVGNLGAFMISVPRLARMRLSSLVRQNPGLTKFDLGESRNSIRDLSPDSLILRAMTDLPIVADVPFHCIMGDLTGKGPPDASDGVVPYLSAHLDGAQSEMVIESDHNVHQQPKAILEVQRILRLHLGELEPVH